MSRRARKEKRAGAGPKAGWLVRSIVVILVLCLVAVGGSYAYLRHYLHSEAFREMLSREVSGALGVEGKFSSIRWDGLAARTSGYHASGSGPVMEIRAVDVRTGIGMDGLRDGYWLIKGSGTRQLEVIYDARPPDVVPQPPVQPEPPPVAGKKPKYDWLPTEVRFDTVDVDQLTANILLANGNLFLRDHRLHVRSGAEADTQDLEIYGGTITTPMEFLPELRLSELKLRHRAGDAFLTTAKFHAYENATLDTTGEWNGQTGAYVLQGSASGVPCAELLNEDWAKRLTGQLSATYTLAGGVDGMRANGTMELRDGILTALPLLDSLSAYADTQRFRMITLHDARSEWEWAEGNFILRNLVLASEGLVRIEGNLMIGEGGTLNGDFRLGIAPGILNRIPGAETHVFSPGERGLLWTTLRVSGSLEKPREDLSDRLIAAAGARMFDILPGSGERVLRQTHTLLQDLQPDAIDRALELIAPGKIDDGRGGKIIREANNILGKLLGDPNPPAPPPMPEKAESP